jgi:hypothetical protein
MTSNYTADELVFLDESSEDDRVILRRYGWLSKGNLPQRIAAENDGLSCYYRDSTSLDTFITQLGIQSLNRDA